MGRPTIGQVAHIWRVGRHEGPGRGRVRSRAKPGLLTQTPAPIVRWGDPALAAKEPTRPVRRREPCPRGQRTTSSGAMTPGESMNHSGPLVHWSGDPYFGRSRKLPMIEGVKAPTRPTREAAGPARPPLPRPACGRRRRAWGVCAPGASLPSSGRGAAWLRSGGWSCPRRGG